MAYCGKKSCALKYKMIVVVARRQKLLRKAEVIFQIIEDLKNEPVVAGGIGIVVQNLEIESGIVVAIKENSKVG